MKKICIVFVCLTLVFSSVGFSTAVTNDTIYVDDDGTADYTSIQDAVDVAIDGDTVYVYSGKYEEHVVISSKSITLQGEDKDSTIIDAGGDGTALFINATHDVSVSGFTFQNSGKRTWIEAGIYVHDSNNCMITDNIIFDCGFGINVFPSSSITISENTMKNNEDGIFIADSENVDVIRNHIEGNEYNGIFLNYLKTGSVVENNFVHNKRHFGFYGAFSVEINANYWQRIVQMSFKPILGKLFMLVPIPGFLFDWNPVREPYNIDEGI